MENLLALAVILLLLASLLALTAGAAAPEVVAISALLTAFAPIAAAQVQGGVSCAVFNLGTITANGSMVQVNTHVTTAVATVAQSLLTYTGPAALLPSRDWLDNTTECSDQKRKAYVAANGTAPTCDEYPFYRTWQGGQTNYRAGKVSLQLVDLSQNSRSGGVFGQYLQKCGIYANMEFKVVPVQGLSSGTNRNGEACYP